MTMPVRVPYTDFHAYVEVAGRLTDMVQIELDIKKLTNLLEIIEGQGERRPEKCFCSSEAGEPAILETMPEDVGIHSEEPVQAILILELDRQKAARTNHLMHLCNLCNEDSRVNYSESFEKFSIFDRNQHTIISWLEENRRFLDSLAAQRNGFDEERDEESTPGHTDHDVSNVITMGDDESYQLTELEKRVKDLLRLHARLGRHRPAQASHLNQGAPPSKLQLGLAKMLENVQIIRQQNISFRKCASPMHVRPKLNDDLASYLSKMHNGLCSLQTAYLACNANIVSLEEAFQSCAELDDTPCSSSASLQPVVVPAAIEQSVLKSTVSSIVSEAFEVLRKEHIRQIMADIPSGDSNPNQQYVWQLLQPTFLIMNEEVETVAFKRSDPDLSGPQFSSLY